MESRTKIVATIGPACDGQPQLEELIAAGIDVARLGLAHGSVAEHLERIGAIRAAAAKLERPVAVLADLSGPKIRTAPFAEGGVFLAEGHLVELVAGGDASTADRIGVEYDRLLDDVRPGDAVSLGDGALALVVESTGHDALLARVVSGGRVQGRPGAHLPSERVRVSSPTEDDLVLLEQLGPHVDFVAVSFVRQAADMVTVRQAAGSEGTMLVAKIETRAAADALESIIDASDAVMVARGDLGTECAIEEVPHLQKRIIRTCVAWGKPVITATQMLESMIHSPTPTRAEASDVANAVFDGTDAVMLSGETAIGHNPALAVRTMARVVARAEQAADYLAWGSRLGRIQRSSEIPEVTAISAAMTHAAWQVAVELGAAAILCCTRSGFTARAMARFRTPSRLLAYAPDERVVRQLNLSWGVEPLVASWSDTTDEMVWRAVEMAVQRGVVTTGDEVVVLAGAPTADAPTSDVLRVVRVR